ncbi:hypothetical protein [Burkholderia contaminans]|nr:hypothetical protein [Burkholderia contaminans]
MNYQTKDRLGLVVVAFLACTIVVVAEKSSAIDTAASALWHRHAQQQ